MKLNEDIFDDVVLVEIPDVVAPIEAENITPPGPEVGEATGIADMILDLINDENEAIKGYNDAKANITCPDFAKVIDDIAAEEMNHVGMLQTLLKKVSPNAEVISQGEEEAENMLQENLENIERTLGKNPKLEIHGDMPLVMADAVIDSEETEKAVEDELEEHNKKTKVKLNKVLGAEKQPVPKLPEMAKVTLDESLFEDFNDTLDNRWKIIEKIEEYLDEGHINKDDFIDMLLQWYYKEPTFISFLTSNNIFSEDELDDFNESLNEDWESDIIKLNGNTYQYWAKVFDEGSQFGINKGRISKLQIRRNGKVVCNYDRGWDIKPADKETKSILDKILNIYKSDESLNEGRKAQDFIDSEGNVFTDEDRSEEDEDDLFTQVMEELCPTNPNFIRKTKFPDVSFSDRYDAEELGVTYDGDIIIISGDVEFAQSVADAYGLNTRESRTGLIIEIPEE